MTSECDLPIVHPDHAQAPLAQLRPLLSNLPPRQCSIHSHVQCKVDIVQTVQYAVRESVSERSYTAGRPGFWATGHFSACADCPHPLFRHNAEGCMHFSTAPREFIEIDITKSVEQQFVEWSRGLKAPQCSYRGRDQELKRVSASYERRAMPFRLHLIYRPCIECALARAHVPPIFLRCSFSNFNTEAHGSSGHLEICRQFAKAPHGFLFLFGNVGTGKTHLAVAIMRALLLRRLAPLFRRHLELLEMHRLRYDCEEGDSKATRQILRSEELLVIDEVRPVSLAKDSEPFLFELLNHRHEHYLPTILTTNIAREDLNSALGSRILDRIRQSQNETLEFGWPSYRSGANADYLKQALLR